MGEKVDVTILFLLLLQVYTSTSKLNKVLAYAHKYTKTNPRVGII